MCPQANSTVALTSSQRKAVETFDRNVCVAAGAGTGKTRVLVERFLYLIEKRVASPGEILAITFTERAAQEMKERIAGELLERGLEQARREIENAFIGTIHGTCARILREHPCEAGLDPEFRILEQDEANLLKQSVLERLIEDRFQEPDIFQLLHVYSEDGIRGAIERVFESAQMFDASISEVASKRVEVNRDQLKISLFQSLDAVTTLTGKMDVDSRAKEALVNAGANWAGIEALQEVRELFRKQGKAKEAIVEFREYLDDWIALMLEDITEPHREAFLKLASEFEARYEAVKREHASLDFSDLERRALRLLGGEGPTSVAIRNLYRQKFKFVMVDEFQDTAPLQDRFITLLSGEENLFVVGDWKQSIYGFRGTDVNLFLEKEKLFRGASKEGRVSITENFRSREALLNFINPFFQELWAQDGLSFEPLKAHGTFPEACNDVVQLIRINKKEDETMEIVRMKEARALARHIHDLVQTGAHDYRDFAMLFRAASDVYFYEHELRALQIPYHVVGGRGFYRQPEIRDMMLMLEVIENPHLDIPLAGVLRSPLVQVSDDTLFWLSNASKGKNRSIPLFHALLKFDVIPEIKGDDKQKLRAFRDLFYELLEEKEKRSTSNCLEYVLAKTRYELYVLGLPQGKRHFANLRKLLEIAREVENREPMHLGDFVRYVKGLEMGEVRESEAQVEAQEGNVVKLMTIHKAKGFEFKVVLLPDLSRRIRSPHPRFLLDPEHGMGLKARNELTRKFEDTLTYRCIKRKRIARDQAESKRILYVAMTRAKHGLVLSGTPKRRDLERRDASEVAPDWFEWISRHVDQNPKHVKNLTIGEMPEIRSEQRVATIEKKSIRDAVERGEPIGLSKTPEMADQINRSLAPIEPVHFERVDLPVSAYSVFSASPEAYMRGYELGAMDAEKQIEGKLEEWNLDEDESALSAADLGTIVHRVFEMLVLDPVRARNRLPNVVSRAGAHRDKVTREEVKKLSEQFISSKLFNEIRSARQRLAEIPFTLRLKKGIIQGTLDLLLQKQNGDWIVLDYKTNQIKEGSAAEHAEQYRTQMMLYVLACHELLQLPVKQATVYFVRPDESFDFKLDEVNFSELRDQFETLQEKVISHRREWLAQ